MTKNYSENYTSDFDLDLTLRGYQPNSSFALSNPAQFFQPNHLDYVKTVERAQQTQSPYYTIGSNDVEEGLLVTNAPDYVSIMRMDSIAERAEGEQRDYYSALISQLDLNNSKTCSGSCDEKRLARSFTVDSLLARKNRLLASPKFFAGERGGFISQSPVLDVTKGSRQYISPFSTRDGEIDESIFHVGGSRPEYNVEIMNRIMWSDQNRECGDDSYFSSNFGINTRALAKSSKKASKKWSNGVVSI